MLPLIRMELLPKGAYGVPIIATATRRKKTIVSISVSVISSLHFRFCFCFRCVDKSTIISSSRIRRGEGSKSWIKIRILLILIVRRRRRLLLRLLSTHRLFIITPMICLPLLVWSLLVAVSTSKDQDSIVIAADHYQRPFDTGMSSVSSGHAHVHPLYQQGSPPATVYSTSTFSGRAPPK